ncbi:PREDICTED: uncharacterized protein LOC108379568 [Rhagoletis zephyria]|uniref:uncharacterized protein LOC108379568 n=1 Tax=Rhagoletis zephyria TaxID=28612 RepID=UPI000811A998|nr:PREDICTED: uncharacterized protein LOC108379568 [Rhagoletis zephyria]
MVHNTKFIDLIIIYESTNLVDTLEEFLPESQPSGAVAAVGKVGLQNKTVEDANKNTMIVNTIALLMESSSSESDGEEDRILLHKILSSDICLFTSERTPRNCIVNYAEQIVPTYSEKEFRTNFRISRSLFENLSERFLHSRQYKKLREDKRLSHRVHLLVFLWFAGHEACSNRDLGDRFDLCLSAVTNVISRVTMFISSLSPDVIKWPTEDKKRATSEFFNRKCFFSKAIGCIDGTHIRIDPPKTGKDDYIDRKGITSICLQGICNEDIKLINIFVGYPGSSYDSWVFTNSTIYDKLSSYFGGNIN